MPHFLLHRDRPIRTLGVAALAIGLVCLHALCSGQVEPAACAGMAVAAAGFVGCSGGALLMLLGAHIHDPVPISRPWAAPLRPWLR